MRLLFCSVNLGGIGTWLYYMHMQLAISLPQSLLCVTFEYLNKFLTQT